MRAIIWKVEKKVTAIITRKSPFLRTTFVEIGSSTRTVLFGRPLFGESDGGTTSNMAQNEAKLLPRR
jgi:hypothetical protein